MIEERRRTIKNIGKNGACSRRKNVRSKDERAGITICNDRGRSTLDQLQLDSPRHRVGSLFEASRRRGAMIRISR